MLSLTIAALEERFAYWESLPFKVEKCAVDAWNAKQSIAALKSAIKEREYTLGMEVMTDKAQYPNKESREAAIQRLLAADDGVQRRLREIDEYEEIKMRAERLSWSIRDESTIIKNHIQASVAVINALAGTGQMREVLLGERKATDKW